MERGAGYICIFVVLVIVICLIIKIEPGMDCYFWGDRVTTNVIG
jgi:hypothetical protein